jgi:arylsulfatase A-like enzyme
VQLTNLYIHFQSMIEEIDDWVGKLLNKLDEVGASSNTLVIFTSDHGEMLGAHAMLGKQILLEEAVRVPLIVSFPERITKKTKVAQPVSTVLSSSNGLRSPCIKPVFFS